LCARLDTLVTHLTELPATERPLYAPSHPCVGPGRYSRSLGRAVQLPLFPSSSAAFFLSNWSSRDDDGSAFGPFLWNRAELDPKWIDAWTFLDAARPHAASDDTGLDALLSHYSCPHEFNSTSSLLRFDVPATRCIRHAVVAHRLFSRCLPSESRRSQPILG